MNHFGIHWFRRDLRVAGNPALRWNCKQNQGRTLGIFFFDSQFLSRPDFSIHRFGFFLQTLKALQDELREMGGDLLVLDHGPGPGFDFLLSKLGSKIPSCITFNRDYEPFARQRDERIIQKLESLGVQIHTERDHLLIEPRELQRDLQPGGFYQVYSPFCKKWLSILEQEEVQERVIRQKEAVSYLEKRLKGQRIEPFFKVTWKELLSQNLIDDSLSRMMNENAALLRIKLPPAGSLAAYEQVRNFKPKLDQYLEQRDFPDLAGTSRLSIYFKNGSITPALVLNLLGLKSANFKDQNGKTQFLKELIWREFYYHILFHCPKVESKAFLSRYKNISWGNNEKWFEAWKEGKTGFPIVDAGMRELKTTGWMHNRVRMIVASFLTKDLLIDWKWGERYFMNELLDGDLAPNNGGWQWAASTGCDPQPYFRVFNPYLQSKKFDPQGEYIRKYVPELRRLGATEIHAPDPHLYHQPIVNHAIQKEKAVALYRDCRA